MARRSTNWNKNRSKNSRLSKKAPMLNLRKETAFRYDLNEILEYGKTDEKLILSFIATVVSKASRQSIQAAKNYVKEKCDEEIIDKDIEKDILGLLNRYTKYR